MKEAFYQQGKADFCDSEMLGARRMAKRAAAVHDPGRRSLLWWIQGQSLAPGGLVGLAHALIKTFPERCPEIQLGSFSRRRLLREDGDIVDCGRISPHGLSLELRRLCIDPRSLVAKDGDTESWLESEKARASEEFPDVDPGEFVRHYSLYFNDIVGALVEYKRRIEEKARTDFALTESGRTIWESLDFSLRTGEIALVNGREGRGKTQAAKQWCSFHAGVARYVSLSALTNKTSVLREIARALGASHGAASCGTELQARIEDVLSKSRLLLCLDESHWLFLNQSQIVHSRPELVDWIGTLSNRGVPVCLISTPQFLDCMSRVAAQAGWNYNQFQRRVKRYKVLGDTSESDLEKVARSLMPGAKATAIKAALGYALESRRDVSAIGDVAREAGEIAKAAGHSRIEFSDVERAINEELLPGLNGFAKAIEAAAQPVRRRRRIPEAPIEPEAPQVRIDDFGDGIAVRAAITPIQAGAGTAAPSLFQETQ